VVGVVGSIGSEVKKKFKIRNAKSNESTYFLTFSFEFSTLNSLSSNSLSPAMTSSVLRRYTPPTCTLEVAAIGSALSRWTDQAVLKNLRFELSFDDPKVIDDRQVTVRGDRNQLEALWEAVSKYVQDFLLRSPEPLPTLLNGQAQDGEINFQAPDPSMQLYLSGIHLQPRGWMSHELHLGTLATPESGEVIALSALQLFDLANALDDYHAEALTLPSLGRPRWLKTVPSGWMPIAAAAVVVVGISLPMVKFVRDVSQPQATTAMQQSNTRDVEISAAQKAGDLPAPTSPGATPPPLTLTPLSPPAPPPVGVTDPFPVQPSAVTVPRTVEPAPSAQAPTSMVIPTEPNFPEIPDNPSVVPASPAAPPRLEGTEGLDRTGAIAARSAPQNATLSDELASAGLATPAPNASPSAASDTQADEVKTYFQLEAA
jgi:Domain of unknown function (DUF4335)